MRGFFKTFFASLLALVIFTIIVVFILIWVVSGVLSQGKPVIGGKSILLVDLNLHYQELVQENPLDGLGPEDQYGIPGVYDLVRMVRHAKEDTAIRGIFLKCDGNSNGFATCEEIRNAVLDFKKSGKFVYAYGDVIPQKAYYIATAADRIYCNPKGGVEWRGFATEMTFLKGTLEKLEIEPQIFYAGKYKSATEPLRAEKMTDANRLQLTELLNDFYNQLLYATAASRKLDTVQLRKCVNDHLVQYPGDALRYKLVDGLKYDDEVKDEIRHKLKLDRHDAISFVSAGKYMKATDFKAEGKDKISLIYAEGDIVDGKGDKDEIGAETYRWLIRKARMDKDVKAIVIRINSGGGSSLASENLWREITVAREEKPVVISFGDVAASGGYYLSCNADSIFAERGTITGSIGVFSVVPNLQRFFKNKLGITFDGVKTSPQADALTVTKPLTPMQKALMQNEVDTIYRNFKSRVADGRHKTMDYVDSIGQGRVWSGSKGLDLGLVDRMGNLQDAVDCAARMAKTRDYRLKEYPEPRSLLDMLFHHYKKSASIKAMKEEMGEDGYRMYNTIRKARAMVGTTQAKLPFDFTIE